MSLPNWLEMLMSAAINRQSGRTMSSVYLEGYRDALNDVSEIIAIGRKLES